MSARCLHKYMYTLCALVLTRAVPPDICQTPLNKGDCGVPPKRVFTYYLPGSRCEIETWMGCPTVNMFETEFECSTTCIFKGDTVATNTSDNISSETSFDTSDYDVNLYVCENGVCVEARLGSYALNDSNLTIRLYESVESCAAKCIVPLHDTDDLIEVVKEVDETIECEIKISTDVCSNDTVSVYTYDSNGVCVQVDWHGCETPNKFDDLISCEAKCNPSWREIDELKAVDLEELVDALDGVHTEDELSGGSDEEDDLYLEEVVLLYQ